MISLYSYVRHGVRTYSTEEDGVTSGCNRNKKSSYLNIVL